MDLLALRDFKPTTAGERLFQGLIGVISPDLHQGRVGDLPVARIPGREAFGDYLEDGLVVFTYKRLMKLGGALLGATDDLEVDTSRFYAALREWFYWLPTDSVDLLFRLAREAIGRSGKSISSAVTEQVWGEMAHPACYFCGRPFIKTGNRRRSKYLVDGTEIEGTLEHIWPRSLGGDSIVENLVPACKPCNNDKDDHFSWAHFPGHELVYRPGFDGSPHYAAFPRKAKLVLQRRAVLYVAAREKITLKESLTLVGPYGTLAVLDGDDTWDFFSMQNHQQMLGEALW